MSSWFWSPWPDTLVGLVSRLFPYGLGVWDVWKKWCWNYMNYFHWFSAEFSASVNLLLKINFLLGLVRWFESFCATECITMGSFDMFNVCCQSINCRTKLTTLEIWLAFALVGCNTLSSWDSRLHLHSGHLAELVVIRFYPKRLTTIQTHIDTPMAESTTQGDSQLVGSS